MHVCDRGESYGVSQLVWGICATSVIFFLKIRLTPIITLWSAPRHVLSVIMCMSVLEVRVLFFTIGVGYMGVASLFFDILLLGAYYRALARASTCVICACVC